ncbi:ABC transporter permease [Bradyrhizobium sp. AUGA SZCCT0283]|uniref:ABC transporter permease n=1 Tax=Bradyrhizobium sp. AUGA SZCCT0283 TaxID=2807671 RepID=UPI001BAA32FB|nr:ABC transporter permease [Bradyrhizobium sp. AUGA SZCCT0283]MBR1274627.1 ABC transporter permease [Bradyrhizobium sp. AUGA SZCCT0283]
MPLVFTLAFRNLFHDRLRFIATVIGIVFSIVLVTVQMGLYLGFGRMVTTMIDHASADLWVMPRGTKCFEDPSLLNTRERYRALAINGVAEAIPVVIGFADWRMPGGAMTPVFVIGSDLRAGGLQPWDLVEGRIEALSSPKAIAVDRSYFDRLGVSGIGATAEIRQQPVRVAAVTNGIRSFTTTPFVFMDVDRARAHTGVPSGKATYLIIRLNSDANLDHVRRQLMSDITDVEVLSPAEFRERSRTFWLFGTGAGAALFAGALLGVIVGTVVVAQTLYASTKEHLNEFATLRAMGSSRRYIYNVIVWQALLSAVIGFSIAALVSDVVVRLTAATALPIVITPGLIGGLFLLTIVMCIGSSIAAIVQVTRIDPAMVFTR